MVLSLSNRHELVLQSEIRSMSIECERIGGINLSQGVCDTEVPPSVRLAAREAIDAGVNTYTRYDGLVELREAIAAKQKRFTGMEVDPATEIVVSAGATGAMYCACLALLNPGDEVIVFEPFYGYHVNTLVAVQAVPVYVRMEPPDWTFTYSSLEHIRTPRTKAIIVNTPANPSGKVFTHSELETIAHFVTKYDLFVFTDEIYEHFLFGDARHMAPATFPGMKGRTITISGFSKTFSITGWRIGYAVCDARWAQTIGFFNDLIYVCAPAPLQMGVAKGLAMLSAEYYQELSRFFQTKRDKLCNALLNAGMEPYVPEGAYYILADISKLPGTGSKQKAMYLLQETRVACVPGMAFFHDSSGEDMARFCFAKEEDVLDEACRRIEKLSLP
ncbi:MAG: aminotransferase class I/II-fold pyridoxal phosphate-dependent enzyme [Deltaproteobacteria bacterium]|nr:aminotransferase class I/II-fold pyridoxal phosphate-dependent enzyme [Deltaproteobacteria bacterium]